MTDFNEELSDEAPARRRANYFALLESEGHTWESTDPAEIAEAYALMAELGQQIELKPRAQGGLKVLGVQILHPYC